MKTIRKWLNRRSGPSRNRDDWNREYAEGQWRFMQSTEEMSRYWIATGYCSTIPRPSILDVGCGSGLLEDKLRLLPYGSYTGIDFSFEALKQARLNMPASNLLVCADLKDFSANETFDIVVFMEPEWPEPVSIPILQRYGRLLRPGGRILFSLFDGRDPTATAGVWKEIHDHFVVEDRTRVENIPSHKGWTIGWISLPAERFDSGFS